MEDLEDIIVMKVGPHSDMSLTEIIDSKNNEEILNGVHYWGYSGVFCRPKQVQDFCKKAILNNHIPKLVLIETKSSYSSDIGFINEYSVDHLNYEKFKYPVQLQGAQYSFVAKNLRKYNNFKLDDFVVVGGKNNGKRLSSHLVYRVNKCFGKYNKKSNSEELNVLIADLVEPYAVWLKE
jgi:hypothetical protein